MIIVVNDPCHKGVYIRSNLTEREPKDVHNHLDNDKLAAPARLGRLALPHRGRRRVDAVADAGDDAADEHLRQAERGDLQDGPGAHDGRAREDRPLPAQPLAEPDRRDGAQEAADVVDGRHGALGRRVVGDAHQVEEVRGHDDAAEDALVVAGGGDDPLVGGPRFVMFTSWSDCYIPEQGHVCRARDSDPEGEPAPAEPKVRSASHGGLLSGGRGEIVVVQNIGPRM